MTAAFYPSAEEGETWWLEQTAADVPPDEQWLSATERAHLALLRFPKRRADWRLGRWTAKNAVAAYLDLSPTTDLFTSLEVRASNSGAPDVSIRHEPAPLVISLSHRDGRAMCAVGRAGTLLGCDLEVVEAHSSEFIADYFSSEEQKGIAETAPSELPELVSLMWSAKESALKALREGLRVDTRSLEVTCPSVRSFEPGTKWQPLSLRYMADRLFQGWWQREADLVRTVVSCPDASPPRNLRLPATLEETPTLKEF